MTKAQQAQSNEVQNLEGNQITTNNVSPQIAFRDMLTARKSSIEKVLPRHVPFEKFQSVVMTACMQNPKLLGADRPSLIMACVKAATDGLLPDGRDAALVIFNSKIKDASGREVWGDVVQYMPMYQGILKKVRQSGELSAISTQVVYSKDRFKHALGDADTIEHEVIDGNDRGEFKAVYCIAKLKDGTVMKEVMYKSDVEKIRKASKAGSMSKRDLQYNQGAKEGDPKGIWRDWPDEMAKKTVFRRLAKWLPQSIDKSGVLEAFANDDTLEAIEAEGTDAVYTDQPTTERLTDETDGGGQIEDQSQGKAKDEAGAQPDLKAEVAKKKPAAASKAEAEAEPKTQTTLLDQNEKGKPEVEMVEVVSFTDGEIYSMPREEYEAMPPMDRPSLALQAGK